VKDVLRYKFRAGLFNDNAYLYSTEQIVLDTPKERQTAYKIATQSVVLLENNGILPLNGTTGLKPQVSSLNVLLTGPNANSMWAMCGDYSFPAMTYFWKKVEEDLDHPHVVTLLEGMQNYIQNSQSSTPNRKINLQYSRGCDWTEKIETKFSELGDERAWEYEILHRKVDSGEKADRQEALRLAKQADVIIAAVGENVMLCGENRDRQGLRLPGKQEQYVEQLIATGKPVILIVFGGRAQVISHLAERCAAVIQAWYPGEEGGNAVADILFGKVTPSGKLSVSYPNSEVYTPLCYNYSDEKDSRVQWPFGYGLTYTTFEYNNLRTDSEASTSDKSLTLSFEVKNTGKTAADEITQIYLSPANASQPIRPIQLQGFARVPLQPGETKTVRVELYIEQFGYYTHESDRSWNIAPGDYVIKIGASSQDIRLKLPITLKGEPVCKPLREFYFSKSTVL
jgi:beta-glucosidase